MRSGGAASKFQYTGQERDAETGLHYYNARYYDPHIRRFTQPDDIIQNVYNPQGLNRYSYVWNNPLKYIDPTGHINILNYNNALNAYWNNPSAITYNNYLNTTWAVQNQSKSTNQSAPAKSGGGGGNSSGGNQTMAAAVLGTAGNIIRQNQAQGSNFEAAARTADNFVKNIKSLGPAYGNRIPDGWDNAVRECKSSPYTCLSPQLRDMLRYSKDTGAQFKIYINEGAKLSKPLQDAIGDVGGKVAPLAPLIRGAVTIPFDSVPIFLNPYIISPTYINTTNDQEYQQI